MAPVRAMVELPLREGIGETERKLGEAWKERYAPEVHDVVVHRVVPNPKLTIIVVSYRAEEYLIDCLRHIRGQTARDVSVEVLLADSGGLEHLRSKYGNLVDVDLRLRPGLPLNLARNAAMAWARGEHVAIVDDDGLVAPTFVEVIERVFEDAAIVAMRGRIVFKEHPYFTTLAGHYDRGDELVDDVLATEGHMAIRRAVYLETGGFPDDFYGAEGVFLAYRIEKVFPGKRAVYVPDLLMRHDYFDGWKNFVWKTRKYRTIREVVGQLEPDPEWLAYLDAYSKKPKPMRALGTEDWIARELVKLARFFVVRAPGWALPKKLRG